MSSGLEHLGRQPEVGRRDELEFSSPRPREPRRPRELPLYRLVEQHLEELLRSWPAGFVRQHGALRPVVERVLREFLKCGLLEHGFARLCSRGGWTASGEWIPLPYVDEAAAEKLFRPHPREGREFEALVRYMMRPPVSLARLHFSPGSHEVVYVPKTGHDESEPAEAERIDAMEFVARVLVQIPDPRRHLVRYYGAYSNASRGKRKKTAASAEPSSPHQAPDDAVIPDGPYRAALRRRWAELIRRVYEVDPLVCPRSGSQMRVIGFITQPA